ncbi:MAG: hypothetical protein LBT81_03450 [Helicobacteraceae bacterium]|nr:hypothetical protein [Helicobacteraceae bacterium]
MFNAKVTVLYETRIGAYGEIDAEYSERRTGLKGHNSGSLFAKIHAGPVKIESFADALHEVYVTGYEWTRNRVMLLIVLLGDTITALKNRLLQSGGHTARI